MSSLPLDYQLYSIRRFVKQCAAAIPPGARVLDAGAGERPYERFFGHVRYQSTDVAIPSGDRTRHAYACSLERIPIRDGTYDAVILTEVLEHVPHPAGAVREVARILKPGGRAYITVPQGWGIHYEPHHYFNFTRYGLLLLLKEAGLEGIEVRPFGGYFIYVGRRLLELPLNVYAQYLVEGGLGSMDGSRRAPLKPNVPMLVLLLPFLLASLPFCLVLIPLLCFGLDPLDRRKDFTLGYRCSAQKPGLAGPTAGPLTSPSG